MSPAAPPRCPHCERPLSRWATPPESTWNGAFQWVCFDDDCLYFVRGWEWMRSRFNVAGSYRYRLDPATGESGPLPVWSADDFKNQILAEEGRSDAL